MKRLLALPLCLCILADAAAAANDIRTLQLATGEVLIHPFERGLPLPAESRWTLAAGAGPAFFPEGKAYRLKWVVHLKTKGSLIDPREITRATIQEVAGKAAIPLFDGPAEVTDKGLMIIAPAHIASRENYPWLYAPDATLLILRVTLHTTNGLQDKLLQPVVIGAEAKRAFQTAAAAR